MLDWSSLALDFLWVLGLAVIVATVSYYYWLTAETTLSDRRLGDVPTCIIGVSFGGWLFCVGMAGLARYWWEGAAWGVLVILFAWVMWKSWKSSRNSGGL